MTNTEKGNNSCAVASGVINTIFLAHPLGSDTTTERTNTARDERQNRSSVMLNKNHPAIENGDNGKK